jgi:hypothetical protein
MRWVGMHSTNTHTYTHTHTHLERLCGTPLCRIHGGRLAFGVPGVHISLSRLNHLLHDEPEGGEEWCEGV